MRIRDCKTIQAKDTRIGDTIIVIHPTETSSVFGPEYRVVQKYEDKIEVFNDWTNQNQFFENSMRVDVRLTENEYRTKYFDTAKDIAMAMNHELYDYGDAYHEMWNGWIDPDRYNMAEKLQNEKLMIVGWFKLTTLKWDDYFDIGIVAEYLSDGERFWCHAASRWFNDWKEYYPELYKEE